MITVNADRNEESQENYLRSTERETAVIVESPKGEIEQDQVPVGACHADRIREENCVRKSRRMQEMLGKMAGVWVG